MTKQVQVKNLIVGGGAPISVQSMTNLPVTDVEGTLKQIDSLQKAGCDILRIAVPNVASAQAFGKVRLATDMPLVADIHFDYRLAIASIEAGADKIRINPGNVAPEQLDRVIDCAKSYGVPIRVGVNAGSLNKEALQACNGNKCQAMAYSLEQYVRYFEKRNFCDLVLSVKSSDVLQTIDANKLVAKLGYPIHLGVTEAGLLHQGLVKNAIGIGSLLLQGVGDTIRVSLTADPVEEVYAGQQILRSIGMYGGVTFVSCPKCGRCSIDLEKVATRVYDHVKGLKRNLKVAVMGCEVNGPGECKDADIGIAGSNGKYVFFKHGQIYKTVDGIDAVEQFLKEVDLLANDN